MAVHFPNSLLRTLAILIALAGVKVPAVAQELNAEGKALAQRNCASCHAIGSDDQSAHPGAPPFRTLSARYPVSDLQEALAEGIVTGHPDMPEFEFAPEEVDALISYLQSIQSR
ncbi:MAG: c-type cytochrome [Gammaproteobacteria bacterium]